MQVAILLSAEPAEVLDGPIFSADELAHACGMSVDWVLARVELEVLPVDDRSGEHRFDSATLVRARRIVALEATFDADPQLAALAADLIEEVNRLRRQLTALQGTQGAGY